MNFFDSSIITPVSSSAFGLCDTAQRAFVGNETNREEWVATVNNPEELTFSFIPVDKGVIQDHELPGVGRCDVLLYRPSHIFFAELKVQGAAWILHATHQLEDTINLFIETHGRAMLDSISIKNRRAYACNRKHPMFQRPSPEKKELFHRTLKVRLFIEATINV